VWDIPLRDLLLNYVDAGVLHRLLLHLPCHTVCPHLWIFGSKLSKCVSRHDNDFHILPPASALRPTSSLLASLFVGSGLCSLRLAGNNSAGDSPSQSVMSSFLRRIQSFHTSTERSKLFKLSRCLLSADSSWSPYQSTISKYCCISFCSFCDSPCTAGINT